MTYRIMFNTITRTYRIRKTADGEDRWVHANWDLELWTDGTFETRFYWRAAWHVWRLTRQDAARTRTATWEP